MENTNNNRKARGRGRARGGRGGGRGVGRGVRSRGSIAARGGARGAQTRGGQRRCLPDRPSVSEPLFCDTLQNIPMGQPLETPLHPKRVRVLPALVANNPRAEAFWSSMEMITQPTPSTSRGQETPSPMPAAPLSAPSPTPSIPIMDVVDMVPSTETKYQIPGVARH